MFAFFLSLSLFLSFAGCLEPFVNVFNVQCSFWWRSIIKMLSLNKSSVWHVPTIESKTKYKELYYALCLISIHLWIHCYCIESLSRIINPTIFSTLTESYLVLIIWWVWKLHNNHTYFMRTTNYSIVQCSTSVSTIKIIHWISVWYQLFQSFEIVGNFNVFCIFVFDFHIVLMCTQYAVKLKYLRIIPIQWTKYYILYSKIRFDFINLKAVSLS